MKRIDRIKNKSVEEMALMLMCPAEYDLNFNKENECKGEMDRNCYQCTLDWLKEEAEG